MRLALRVLLPIVIAVLAACSDSLTAPHTDLLSARAVGSRLFLTNRTDEPVFYFAIERQSAALIDWGPCADPSPGSTCPRVAAHQTISVPFSGIAGYESGATEANVYHWRLIPGAAPGISFTVSEIRRLTVRLR